MTKTLLSGQGRSGLEADRMMNITKGDLIDLIASAQSLLNPNSSTLSLYEQARTVYTGLVPQRQGQTDRLVLGGYIVLLEGSLSYDEIANPDKCQKANLLLPKKGLELFLQDLLAEGGMDPAQTKKETSRLLRRFSKPAKIHRKLMC